MKNVQPFPDIAFEQEVSSRAAFLRQIGFKETIEYSSTVLSGEEIPLWKFIFTGNGRTVTIRITWPYLNPIIRCSYGESRFLFEDYLALEKKDDVKKLYQDFFPLRDDYNARRKYSLSYIDIFIRYARNELRSVLEGKEWIEVPIDWTPYK